MNHIRERMEARRARAEDWDLLCVLIPGFALVALLCFLA